MHTSKGLLGSLFLLLVSLVCSVNRAAAQQVVGISAILDVSNGYITTYSATEVDYATSAYYEPYVEGYLYENGNLIGAGSATANTYSNCDGNISSQVAEGCIQKPDSIGSNYQIESDHYLITAFAYYDGSGTPYYSNPDGFFGGAGGSGPDYSSFLPGGGPAYVDYQYIYLGTTAVNGTVQEPSNNTPNLTGIQPNIWPAGVTTPGVVFSGQYFGTNPPTINFSPGGGISYTVTSSNDTQIVADVTVAAGTPDEDLDVSVTSNGNNGQAFAPTGGGEPTGGSVKASVRAPINAPEVTIIAWVNGDAVALPSGANATIVSNLTQGTSNCFIQVGQWTFGNPKYLSTQADRDYANAWLVKYSGNGAPPSSINAQEQLSAGDFRLFNVWGGSSTQPTYKVGVTPDPCKLGFVPKWVEGGEASHYMGLHGTSASGNSIQLAEGRVGWLGKRGSSTINQGRTVPWIWSAIEFDANGNFASAQHEIFPTYSVYVNGQLNVVYPQSDVPVFILKDESNQITSASQVP